MTSGERKSQLIRLSNRLIQCHELAQPRELAHGNDRLISDGELIALDETILMLSRLDIPAVIDDGGGKVIEESQIG